MLRKTLLALAAIAAIAAPSAQAHSKPAPGGPWKVVASGLDNPRGIALAKNGDLWISEAGRGGAGPCFPGEEPDSPPSCFGSTGAFTVVHNGWQKRVVSGLPSLADQGTGDNALGPAHIVVDAKHATAVIGGGSHPEMRAATGPAGALFGWMIKFNPWSGKVTPFADLLQYEADNNPDMGAIDSDLFGLARVRGGFVVADAAANAVLGVDFHKHITTRAVFPDVQVLAPPFLGLPSGAMIPMQAVPTSVAVRPKDPNLYVGQLTGFPFPPGAASVFGVRPDGSTFVYATGFTNITDIAWGPKGWLYVVEIASNGLASGDTTGAVIKISPDASHTKTVVASTGLSHPTAIAIAKDGTVYVTNNGSSAGTGTVLNLGKL